MTYDFEAVVDVASAYKLDAEDLDQFANAISHEFLFRPCSLPKSSEDPIPKLTHMAQSLPAGCRAEQEFTRLERCFVLRCGTHAGDLGGAPL